MAFSCYGQAYTLQDTSFVGNLLSGNTAIQTCGNFTAHLVGYWKMDKGSGTIFPSDLTGNPIGGSLNNGSIWVNDGPLVGFNVRQNYSVQCPQYNSYVTMGYTDNDDYYVITNNYSASCWAYHLAGTPNAGEVMFGGYSQAGAFHFGMGIMQNRTQYGFGDITLQGYRAGPTLASVGQNWTFWVMTRNGQTWTLWKDDASVGPAATVIDTGPQQTQNEPCYINIGNNRTLDAFQPKNWNGYIADFRLYRNYALSSNEVWCLYHQYYGRN